MTILTQIQHVVVVMFENRSLDHMLGWLYSSGPGPQVVLPPGSEIRFDGLNADMSNPLSSDPSGRGAVPVRVAASTSGSRTPDPDPQETFENVSFQLFRTTSPAPGDTPSMQGFVDNYNTTTTSDAKQIMQCHSPAQLPVLSGLARAYAVSDAWFCSVPSQTWPNRAFVHAGTSNGHVNNGEVPDPLKWDVPTIFNVLTSIDVSWKIYRDTLVPSLTGAMFPQLWDPELAGNFASFSEFQSDCAHDSLPRYSFIEPRFVSTLLHAPNDYHPPHDVNEGEALLFQIWKAVSESHAWEKTLLVITFDEHGGCFDHVPPPCGATPPDTASQPGDAGFGFDRFGVRVPTILVSPYIAAGTVFRSPTDVPYDHTSILATLRDWIGIPAESMLPSERIKKAPTLEQVLTLRTARPPSDLPSIQLSSAVPLPPDLSGTPNDLQMSLVSATASHDGLDPAAAMQSITTHQHVMNYFQSRAAKRVQSGG